MHNIVENVGDTHRMDEKAITLRDGGEALRWYWQIDLFYEYNELNEDVVSVKTVWSRRIGAFTDR